MKIKLKQAEDSKIELKQRIQGFELLQESLNLDRKRIDEQLNKINWEEDFKNKLKAVDESMSAPSGLLLDDGVTAVIDDDRSYVRILDANGNEKLKVKLQEPDIPIDEDVLTKEMDNSMLAMETENQFPVRKQGPRFMIHAPDFDQSDSHSFQVNAPRRHNVKSMVFIDDEVDGNFLPDESSNM